MSFFKSFLNGTAKCMRQAIVMLIFLQLFIQVKANSAENSSRNITLHGYPICDSLCYEEFMTNPEQVNREDFTLAFTAWSKSGCILNILGLSIENDEFYDMRNFETSSLTESNSDAFYYHSTEQNDVQKIRICSKYVPVSKIKSKLSKITSFNLILDASLHREANDIVKLIPEKGIFHAIKFLFPKFSPDSQQIIIKGLNSLFSEVSNWSEPNLFNGYMDALINSQEESKELEGRKIEFLKSMIISLFVETIIHHCINSLPVNLSNIAIYISCDSLICVNIVKHLKRFSKLKSINLYGSYFKNAEMSTI